MNLKQLVEHAESQVGDDWENLNIDIPDEFNGGWLTVTKENVVIEDGTLALDFSKTYPDEYE